MTEEEFFAFRPHYQKYKIMGPSERRIHEMIWGGPSNPGQGLGKISAYGSGTVPIATVDSGGEWNPIAWRADKSKQQQRRAQEQAGPQIDPFMMQEFMQALAQQNAPRQMTDEERSMDERVRREGVAGKGIPRSEWDTLSPEKRRMRVGRNY